ncbi:MULTISPECIES: MarR family winged helix-turn-helix transcriptional regulator [Methanosarcina]|jgi:DNA-binding MarR family transcriptional regulator|uniref:MarR family transcriptional regulator n=6 Tax=Methanosarcina mazei TaxID=2209 RepID=A0A0F8E8Y4_METMZ|nr:MULTISPECIES: MarR family transcriptional regulator [Methanosarcina]AAM32547.1 transcriptional regulator, MarR family [Methanosarcina mazei Go1]AKB61738.1 Transcriptional regulator, MarR family [Methanosarcina mazei SarPi]AKB65063.1 Transcriptional regulator, MarR family [Methanosarcina mazei S-6]AKB67886.1 Transcriptional regulator, MarR family [Methanosarcina mazei LYC]AKB71141.1 Transcriptional regulator, MarR family [Methanosarcina mazei C16]
MDPERIKKIRLMDLEFRALHSKLFEEMFFKKIAASKNAELKELSKNQPAALMIIGLEKEIMPSTIGIYMGMDRSSLSRMVDSLEEKGFVRRNNDPEDRRKVLVSLTEKGEKCSEILNKISEEMSVELLGLAGEQDFRDFENSLETMLRVLRKIDSSISNGK